MTNNNNYYENDEISSDNESLSDNDQKKCEFIANSEHLYDADYYATFERDNTYYLTIPYLNENNYLKDLHISSRGFFNHSLYSVQNYIREYTVSSVIPDNSSLEIVKTSYIQLPCGIMVANVIIKTFWLRIVQRRWRNVMKKHIQPQLRGCLADMKKRIQ